MCETSETEAIDRARTQLKLGPATPVRAWRVRRADQPGRAYYLVVFGERRTAVGVAAVDATTAEVMLWATLPGTGPHPILERNMAAQRAGFAEGSRLELVWQPCKGSRSMLCLLWEVNLEGRTLTSKEACGNRWRFPTVEDDSRLARTLQACSVASKKNSDCAEDTLSG